MARKPGKKQKENPVGCKDEKKAREGFREDKTGPPVVEFGGKFCRRCHITFFYLATCKH